MQHADYKIGIISSFAAASGFGSA